MADSSIRGSGRTPKERSPWARGFAPDGRLLVVGIALWLLLSIAYWPTSLSFGDEVGYVGNARMLLEGRLHPAPTDVGVWVHAGEGPVTKYPLFLSLLVAPLFAVHPMLVFVIGHASLLLLVWAGARVLPMLGARPAWALLFLAHPTFVLLARTVMVDVLFAAAAVAAFLFVRRDARVGAFIAGVLVVLSKPTGAVFLLGLLVGEAWRRVHCDRRSFRRVAIDLSSLGAGGAMGLGMALGLNLLSTGGLGYGGYEASLREHDVWSLDYVIRNAMKYGASMWLLPPLGALGVLGFVARREYGALGGMLSLFGLMLAYVFSDFGATYFETLVIAPRLVLPVLAFLLLGYGALLERWRPFAKLVPALLIAAVTLVTAAVGVEHSRWLEPLAEARREAAEAAIASGSPAIGLVGGAEKTGILLERPVLRLPMEGAVEPPPVVLCSRGYPSRRAPGPERSCELDGYEVTHRVGDHRVLSRIREVARD